MKTNSDEFIFSIESTISSLNKASLQLNDLNINSLKNEVFMSNDEKDRLIVALGNPQYSKEATRILKEKYKLTDDQIVKEVENKINSILGSIC
jgi:hypothetical protein